MPLRRFIRCRNGTAVEIHDWGSRVILPGGRIVLGAPQGTAEQAATARELGYQGGALAMVCDHDPLHALLTDWLGFPVSFSLSGGDPVAAADEEAAVMAVQKLMRRHGGRLP
jgi:hypothetical protein